MRVSVSPVIPALNEHEIEAIVQRAAQAGAASASYIILRLPHELSTLFPQWLEHHFPDKASRVLNALRDVRSNKLNDAEFTSRMRGSGPRADIIQRRFELACKRAGIDANGRQWNMNVTQFVPPRAPGDSQLSLF